VPVTATYSGDGAENNFATSMSPTVTVNVVPAATPPVRPAVSQLRFSPHTFNAAGRKVHGQCVKATQKNRRAAPCERALKLTTAYQLSVAGKVSFKLVRSRAGRKVHGHCVKATPANQQHAPCTLLSSIGKTVIRSGVTGANTFTFTGTLAPGTYRLTVIPAGGTGRTAHFRVTASRARPAPARRVRNIPRRDS